MWPMSASHFVSTFAKPGSFLFKYYFIGTVNLHISPAPRWGCLWPLVLQMFDGARICDRTTSTGEPTGYNHSPRQWSFWNYMLVDLMSRLYSTALGITPWSAQEIISESIWLQHKYTFEIRFKLIFSVHLRKAAFTNQETIYYVS